MKFRQKPKSGIWMVDYEDDHGTRKRMSTGIKTEPMRSPPPEVKQAGREIVLGIRAPEQKPAGKARKQAGQFTMNDLFDRCEKTVWHPDEVKSQATIRSNLKILRSMIGDVPVTDMSFNRLEKLIADLKARGYAPGTIKRKLDMVSKSLRMATMWTDDAGQPLLLYKPPMPTITVNNTKERIISPLEEQAIFTAIEKRRQLEPGRQWFRFAALLRFLFDTGGRLGEALGLGPSNITSMGAQSYVTFPRYRTKSGKPRSVPLTAAAVGAFAGLMDHLVLDKATGEFRFFGFTPATAWYMFVNVKEDVTRETGLNLDDVTLHTIRHTTLTRLAQGGMGLAQLQMWAGHSDPKITAERYLHLSPSDLVSGIALLSNPSPGEIGAGHGTKPVIVPDTFAGGNGANLGTHRLQ